MLKKLFYLLIMTLLVFCSNIEISYADTVTLSSQPHTQAPVAFVSDSYKDVSALTLVAQPSKYLNNNVKIKGKFDKFTAIGLDYPPIKREAKTYISFMIKRENVTAYNIPLSELKLIVKRDYAEKELVNIEAGDEIDIYGTVFSNALGDPWVDVNKVVILTPKTDKTKK